MESLQLNSALTEFGNGAVGASGSFIAVAFSRLNFGRCSSRQGETCRGFVRAFRAAMELRFLACRKACPRRCQRNVNSVLRLRPTNLPTYSLSSLSASLYCT